MRKEIFFTLNVVTQISVLIIFLALSFNMFYDQENRVMDELSDEHNLIESLYYDLDEKTFSSLKIDIDDKIVLFDKDGEMIFDSKNNQKNTLSNSEDVKLILNQNNNFNRKNVGLMQIEYSYYEILDNGEVLIIYQTVGSYFSVLFSIIHWIIMTILALLIINKTISKNFSKKIAGNINGVNFENLLESNVYEEFAPFVSKINSQQNQISESINVLNQRDNEFETIIKKMREGLIVLDKKGELLSCNNAAIELLSLDTKPENRTSFYILNRNLEFFSAVEKTLKGKATKHKQNIGRKICKFYLSPVITEGETVGAVILIVDVTELNSREQMRREFTANVSHELKTPLTSISGYAEIIKNGIVKEKDIAGFAEKIYLEAQRLIALILDIIKLSQLDEYEGEIQKTQCNLYKIAEMSVDRISDIAQNAKVKISIEGEDAYVQGVSPMLEEMIYNLCDNAVKYNKKNGKVSVRVSNEKDKVLLSISDTGIGIPEEDIDRIFERFYRVDKSHSKETGGTGLGLSIVKHCVLLHNGDIKTHSKENEGTKIEIFLPAIKED